MEVTQAFSASTHVSAYKKLKEKYPEIPLLNSVTTAVKRFKSRCLEYYLAFQQPPTDETRDLHLQAIAKAIGLRPTTSSVVVNNVRSIGKYEYEIKYAQRDSSGVEVRRAARTSSLVHQSTPSQTSSSSRAFSSAGGHGSTSAVDSKAIDDAVARLTSGKDRDRGRTDDENTLVKRVRVVEDKLNDLSTKIDALSKLMLAFVESRSKDVYAAEAEEESE